MSSKKKKVPSTWVLCESCNVILSDRDVSNHNTDCPPGVVASYPYIIDDMLHCSLDKHIFQDISGLIDANFTVLLSTAVLQLCRIPIGDPVVITSSTGNSIVRKAWKGHDRQQLSASLCENDDAFPTFSSGHWITVQPLTKITVAREIVVECEGDCKESWVLPLLRFSNQDRVLQEGNQIVQSLYGKREIFTVTKIKGFDVETSTLFYSIIPETIWRLDTPRDKTEDKPLHFTGCHGVMEEIEECLAVSLGDSSPNSKIKARGILIYGINGTGKTILMKFLAKKWAKTIIDITIADLTNDSDFETALQQSFIRAQREGPSIITIDDLDLICKASQRGEHSNRFGATLAALLDKLYHSQTQVLVLATATNVNQIDRALRRPGRFDKEVEVGVPTQQERLEILESLLNGDGSTISKSDLKVVADIAHGFVGADLSALLSKALVMAVRENSALLSSHLHRCLPLVSPSAVREFMVQVPDVRWEDIGGQNELKHQLRQAVEWPLKYPDSFERLGISPPRGVLMYGPPGCSKTMIAKALATESGLNFISIKGPELFSKWVGESEKAVREVFLRARQAAPSIIFFDELDALAGERSSAMGGAQVQERVLAQLLTELDGVEALGHVIVVGATNRPDRIDPALLRPGRLDRVVYVPLPDQSTRCDIFRIQFRKTPVDKDVIVAELAELTDGYSGAEVVAVCNEAAMFALDEDLESTTVARRHFQAALKVISPRTSPVALQLCEKYRNRAH